MPRSGGDVARDTIGLMMLPPEQDGDMPSPFDRFLAVQQAYCTPMEPETHRKNEIATPPPGRSNR